MSGMFDSKTDKASRKQARTQKEEQDKRKSRKIAITVTVAFLLIFCVAFLLNSNILRRTLPVLTIDGVDFSTTEFEYFFNADYMEYMNFMSQFQGMGDMMPDQNRPLSSQIYNHETGETWAEMITSITLERLSGLVQLYNAAIAADFSLSDEDIAGIEDDIARAEMEAMMYGFPSTDSLLQQMFGNSINERIYREVLEFTAIATSYSIHMRDSFEYSDAELNEYYAENADSLDVFTYRMLTVFAEYPEETDLPDDEAEEDAINNAYFTALGIADGIEDEYDFINEAMGYDFWSYSQPESTLRTVQGERLETDLSPWLLDGIRAFGDITVIRTEQGANIIFFVSREDNSYHTVGMRQILILRDYVNPEEFDEMDDDSETEYLLALETAENEARERAELVHELFIAAGSAEQALLDLMEEHSDDTTEGGYYSQISRFTYHGTTANSMKVVPEIENWLFDESREIGDSELIYTADFGYHLIYFTGFYERLSDLMADDRLRAAEHSEWIDSFVSSEPVRRAAFILVNV
jgi:hypothetical protein